MMTDYKELYLLHCANLSDCTTKEDVKRHNAAMKQLGICFRSKKVLSSLAKSKANPI